MNARLATIRSFLRSKPDGVMSENGLSELGCLIFDDLGKTSWMASGKGPRGVASSDDGAMHSAGVLLARP